jgi:type I restriction enzyme M protein
MAIKKSQLYSSIWKSCDELRGGMDASQYKDYVLVLLFIKYISDKYAGVPYAAITVPEGSSFKDMVALKGKVTIGDDINKKIIQKIEEQNPSLGKIAVDFNDPAKLGSGKDMVKRLTNLIAIFENPALDFSRNRAEGDDILGDAYEYLMKNFATQSGKSKGQFYTPAEVSRVIARTIGIANTKNDTPTVYDPTCGSGSLLLKVADETDKNVKLCGQEMDNATAALARMNMILHNHPISEIVRENTISTPLFKNGNQLKTFDFVVANPPFSFKSWSSGIDPAHDEFRRFQYFGIPPAKNGDYAFILHIIHSLKTTGKGACVAPHGVLFRGNAEAGIRTNIIRRGYIKGIIGLPANLFYGTGIPACIIVLDKENADNRKGIFMIDASKGFIKDGNKNRLRAQDIHKIVDVFNRQLEIPKYSRMVSVVEIEKNDFNLNIPRYIDSQEAEDIQDIEAHIKGDIPTQDIEDLQKYWSVYPTLKNFLFGKSKREGYSTLKVPPE